MNRADVEMLQQSIQHLGQGAFERQQAQRQMQMEMQRNALEQQFRQAQLAHETTMEDANNRRADVQQSRADADKAHYQAEDDANNRRADNANQPKVQADLKHSDGTTMTFTGTPQQLQAMQDAAKAKGDNITVANKKNFAAQFTVGDAQFSFDDPDAADKFATNMKSQHGIDVYANQGPSVTTTPGGQELVTDRKGHVVKGAPASVGPTQTVKQVVNPMGGSPLSLTNTTTHLPATGMDAPAPPQPAATPAPSHVAYLQAHPETAGDFDAKYGQGASSQFLKPQQPIPGGGGFQIPQAGTPQDQPEDQ